MRSERQTYTNQNYLGPCHVDSVKHRMSWRSPDMARVLILGGDEQQMTGNFYKVKRWPGDGKIICSKCKKYIINSSRKRYKDAQIYMREFGIQPPKKESSPWTEEDFEEHNGLPQNCTWYGLHNSRIELTEKKEKKPKNEPE